MDKVIHEKYIPQQLLYFIAGRRCCQQLSCSFRTLDNKVIMQWAQSLGLRSQYVISGGQKCVKVCKLSCRHFLEEPKKLTISPSTMMEMDSLTVYIGTNSRDERQIPADIVGEHSLLTASTLQLPMGVLSPPAPRKKSDKYRNFFGDVSTFSCHMNILTAIYMHRVVVFKGDLQMDKSLLLPIIILDDSEFKKSNLKMICIEKETIVAMNNSERFANYLDESIGETIGLEVSQLSVSSSSTHILFTTAKCFLSSVLNKNKNLNNISHFVVSDVHLHDAYTDILLSELKKALAVNQNLRIILHSQRCDSKIFLDFFGEGTEVSAESPIEQTGSKIFYLEDINSSIAGAELYKGPQIYKDRPQIFRATNVQNENLDKFLEVYEAIGTDTAIGPFLYSVNYELSPVNYQHSMTGKSALIIAAQLNNVKHLRLLLFMGANPYIVDNHQDNAISTASARGNDDCVEVLKNYGLHGFVLKNLKAEFVDFDCIIDIMYLLYAKSDYPKGNILIILPSFLHLVKLNYMLLSHFLNGYLHASPIFLLHENMKREDLDALLKAPADTLKIILATTVIESLVVPVSFKYLIDTVCEKRSWSRGASGETEDKIDWLQKDGLFRRFLLLHPDASAAVQCFRLMTKETYEQLEEIGKPTLQTMPLDKICLIVKLLSPHSIISEYLAYTISPPPLIHVHQAVQFLKKIDVLDDFEDVTWLGFRLVDIPVPCQLGRALVFGILLQCLDPVLTIVSSFISDDPLSLPFNEDIDALWDKFAIFMQNSVKQERHRLAADQLSDHFVFLHIYQEWQDRFQNNLTPLCLSTEYEFMLNGLMEQLTFTRSKILSALRAANLVHCQGALSIQHVNSKSDNWPLAKAALTGGLYPSICAIDRNGGSNWLKSAYSTETNLHPNTVIRQFMKPCSSYTEHIFEEVDWLVCRKQRDNIKYASVAVPLAVALFAGSPKLDMDQTVEIEPSDPSSNDSKVHFYIDEWIWMQTSKPNIDLVMKTRQHFFRSYQYLLRYCCDSQKWRIDSKMAENHRFLVDALATMFYHEDVTAGFKPPPPIGVKPCVKVQKWFLLNINSYFSGQQGILDQHFTSNENQIIERQFFLLYTKETVDDFYQKSDAAYIENVIGKFVRPLVTPTRQIFVILYTTDPNRVLSISRVEFHKGTINFREYFRNVIPVSEIIYGSASFNVNPANFSGRIITSLIDKRVGHLIMDLFAFRNYWIHNE
ncbi:benign gonial cell neoplasm protein [Drosophila sulfurigaster albostrigata]|uniref:benign gonial cell neoplasm protein n=1 Tax=Drosophila sulfurigaster albostrigata TaxID=89887 RepID=UPI002D21A8AF|nr:benign gonial cell neoplasm protein [Drosophila sulfurigaster albostrigata]